VVGETPNLAARLQALAAPNSVCVSDSTQKLIAKRFYSDDLGHKELKGFSAPVRAWRVVGEVETENRFDTARDIETPLVGRGEELELLCRCWERARAGEGQVALLSGEPGIGKSRLIAALDEHLRSESHTR